MYDPFGYYTPKNIYYEEKSFGAPFYEDYPMNDYSLEYEDVPFTIIEPTNS